MSLTKQVNGETVECTPEEEAAIRAEWMANTPTAAQILAKNKAAKLAAIDAKTETLLTAGFSYTPSGQSTAYYFALDPTSQTTWMGLQKKADAGRITSWPYPIVTTVGAKTTLANAADVDAFYVAAETRVEQIVAAYNGGAADLKSQVVAAVDEAALDAITDSRV